MKLVWTLWLLAIVVSFGVFESWALAHHTTTLSRYLWNLSQAWPPFPFVCGLVVGGLAVHLWWRWDPAVPTDRRG